jgi:hypothetical protein
MSQNKRKKMLFGFTVVLCLTLITSVFYITVTAQPVNADDVIKMVNDWESKSLQNGQWVHLIYAVTLMETNGVILPNGQPMPSSYINDDWYYVNEVGLVEKGVFSMKDDSGNIFQQSAFQNNIMINFTFGDRQEGQEPYPLNIDLGFENQIREATNNRLTIKKSDDVVEGKPSFAYSYTEELKLPTQLGNEKIIVDSITKKGFFDKEIGDFVQTQTIWVLSDGTEVVYETVYIISVDSHSATNDEISKILEGVK